MTLQMTNQRVKLNILPQNTWNPPTTEAPFEWDAPDLQEGGEWCEARLKKLRTITEGWRLLASHRLN
jgi:hypothetical protein